MKIYLLKLITFCSIWCVLFACKPLDMTIQEKYPDLPNDFANNAAADSSNIALTSWRDYFTDPALVQLIEEGLNNNLDMKMAMQRVEMAQAGLIAAKGNLLPQADALVGAGIRKFGLYTMDGAGNSSTDILPGRVVPEHLPDFFLGMQASWEVDIWKRLRNQQGAALANYLASTEVVNLIRSNLVAEIAFTYYELLALDNELDFVRQTIEKQEEALEIIKIQKEAGRATELAVQQFTAQVLNARSVEKMFIQLVVENENKINFLLARYPQPVNRNKASLYEEPSQVLNVGLPAQLLENRPDVRQAAQALMATKFDLKAARVAFYPRLHLTGLLGFQAFSPRFLFNTPASLAYSLLGNFTAPLINLNALKAQFRFAKAHQIQAMHTYQATLLNGYLEVIDQLNFMQNQKAFNELKEQEAEALTDAIDISTELYKSAKATYLEVLITQQNALQANIELIESYQRLRVASISLYRALGGGWR